MAWSTVKVRAKVLCKVSALSHSQFVTSRCSVSRLLRRYPSAYAVYISGCHNQHRDVNKNTRLGLEENITVWFDVHTRSKLWRVKVRSLLDPSQLPYKDFTAPYMAALLLSSGVSDLLHIMKLWDSVQLHYTLTPPCGVSYWRKRCLLTLKSLTKADMWRLWNENRLKLFIQNFWQCDI